MVNSLLATVRRAAVDGPLAASAATNDIQQPQQNDALAASDDQAINAAVKANLTAAAAAEVWQERWRASAVLQHEFSAPAHYAAFMNQCLHNARQRAATPARRSNLAQTGVDHDEAAAIENARAKGLNSVEMAALWRARFADSPALRAEFGTADCYAAFMNAAAAGRMKVHQGQVR